MIVLKHECAWVDTEFSVAQAFLPAVSRVSGLRGAFADIGGQAERPADKNVGDTAGRNACATQAN